MNVQFSNSGAEANWYAAYTLPNFEKKVFSELTKKNVDAYLPLQKVRRQWSDRVKKLEVPLFRNYIFVKTTDVKRRELTDIKGILKFIGFEGRAAVIAEKDILTIRRLQDGSLEVESTLVEGARVRVVYGPLAGLEGRLFSKNGRSRVGIHIESIRQSLTLEIPALYLQEARS